MRGRTVRISPFDSNQKIPESGPDLRHLVFEEKSAEFHFHRFARIHKLPISNGAFPCHCCQYRLSSVFPPFLDSELTWGTL